MAKRGIPGLVAALSVALAGCGGATVASTPPVVTNPIAPILTAKARYAYTGNQGASISGYAVNTTTGALTALAGFPLALGLNPTAITHDALNRFVFVADIAADQVHVLAISGTGALSEVSGSPYTTFREPVAVIGDPSGTHVYLASQDANSVAGYSLSATGALSAIGGSPFADGGALNYYSIGSQSLVMNTAGTMLYSMDVNNVYVFSVNSGTGALTRVQTIAAPGFGDGLALDPAGTYLYAVGSDSAPGIFTYAVNSGTGQLTLAGSSAMLERNGAYTITISPTGASAYTIENNNDLVSYTLSGGKFTPVGVAYAQVYGEQVAVDPSGSFVYVPQACSSCPSGLYNVVNELTIGSTGALTRQAPSSISAGMTPWGMTITQ